MRLRIFLIIALCVLFLALFALARTHSRAAYASVEAKFTDASASGLAIVPASCPSDPHWVGECDNPPSSGGPGTVNGAGGTDSTSNSTNPSSGRGCSIGIEPQSAKPGQGVTLGWNTGMCSPAYGCTYFGFPIAPGSASITPVIGSVPPTGEASVVYTSGTTYTLTGTYYASIGALFPVDTFSCLVYLSGQNSNAAAPSQQPSSCPTQDVCRDSATLLHVNGDCTTTVVSCPFASYGYGCSASGSSAGCLTPPPPSAELTVKPTLVHRGDTVSIEWHDTSTQGASLASCTVHGSDGESWSGTSGNVTSSAIQGQTVFTLNCTGIDGTTIQPQPTTVNIIPSFQEK